MNHVSFGSVVRDTRQEFGLSVSDIEKRTHGRIRAELLNEIESDQIPGIFLPPLFIKSLAMALGVNFAYLLAVAGHLSVEQLRTWKAWGNKNEIQVDVW